jgi:hypothetical protein
MWLDYVVHKKKNVPRKLMVPLENNYSFVANMISSSSLVIPFW